MDNPFGILRDVRLWETTPAGAFDRYLVRTYTGGNVMGESAEYEERLEAGEYDDPPDDEPTDEQAMMFYRDPGVTVVAGGFAMFVGDDGKSSLALRYEAWEELGGPDQLEVYPGPE